MSSWTDFELMAKVATPQLPALDKIIMASSAMRISLLLTIDNQLRSRVREQFIVIIVEILLLPTL